MVVRAITDFDPVSDIETDAGRMYCCGAAELYAVHNNPVEKILDACYKARHKIRAGLVVATTGSYQPKTEENLKAAGFKVLHAGLNPRMGGKFTFWGLDVSNIPLDPAKDNDSVAASMKEGGAKNLLGSVFVP